MFQLHAMSVARRLGLLVASAVLGIAVLAAVLLLTERELVFGEAVAKMDQTTQQNAALVEQSAAAAESLRRQAAQLLQAVEQFRLNEDASAAA